MSLAEAACGYATILLNDADMDISAENIATLLKAACITVDSYWPALFAKLAEKRSVDDLISTVGAGGGGGAVAAAAAPAGGAAAGGGAAAPPPEEKKKEEPEEESDDDMGFSLFD